MGEGDTRVRGDDEGIFTNDIRQVRGVRFVTHKSPIVLTLRERG